MSITTVVKSKPWLILCVILFIIQAIVWIIVGRLLQMDAAHHAAAIDLEEKVHYSISTGSPLIFQNGRLGVILDTKTAQNGKYIAYRVVSFVMPEDVELTVVPKKLATYKLQKGKARKKKITAEVRQPESKNELPTGGDNVKGN